MQGAHRGPAPAHGSPPTCVCRVRGAGHAPLGMPPAPPHTPGEFLPLGASLSCGDRPGPQACRATLLAPMRPSTRGPATLTKPSHRRPSPPGTGSGIARAPPRWSCSAPAGRTWASPETSSSGGRGARRWPSGGPLPAAARSPLRPPLARPPRGWPDPAAPAARAAPDAATPGERPLSAAAAPTSLGNVREPALRLEAAPAAVPLQPLPGPTPHNTRSRHSARSGSCGRDLPGNDREPIAKVSREQLPEATLGQPRSYPIWNLPVGGGVREREAALARRETKLGRRGRNSRGLSTSRTRRRRQQRMPRAPLCGRLGECLAPWRKATDCDRVAGEKSQKIFELQATCSLEPAISKKPLQEQTGPVQKAVAFLSAQGHMTYSWGC